MMDMEDGPLDFESEDALASSPVLAKKRRKVIGLDDLINDYYKEKIKVNEKESKRTKSRKNYSSEEDDDTFQSKGVAEFSKVVDECEQQMEEISNEEDISPWGIHVFGDKKTPPPLVFPALENCMLLQSFMNNELNSLVDLSAEKGESFLRGLLVNGWLLKLASTSGHVEESIATWTLYLLLYSSEEEPQAFACDFWCAILSSENEIRIDWFPSYIDFKRALEVYGLLLDSSTSFSSNSELLNTDSDCGGPPQNIRAWMKFVAICCQVRSRHAIFSSTEAEELLETLICFFLDRQLQGLSMLMDECVLSVMSFFTDEEWDHSCNKVAKSLAGRVLWDLNCLRIVECISGINTRSKHLKSAVAYEMLILSLDSKVSNGKEILRILSSINLKGKSCDYFKTYIYLVLSENWLLAAPSLENKSEIYKEWDTYLRNCSCQISTRDIRCYASKVRSKASYLLQGTVKT